MNGLDISEEQFIKMSAKERDLIMFKNLKYLRSTNRDNPWIHRVAFIWLFALSVAIGLRKWLPL